MIVSDTMYILQTIVCIYSTFTLNLMYISVLRPTLEYASVVWVICAKHDKERLRKKTVELLELSLILLDDLST